MTTYLFYDIETTGLDKAFDQVLQFAAIRTDQELNELSRHQFYVKLSPDVIPSPIASITHRISIAEANFGLTELEAICKIHQLMNEPGTISCGYNTLGFDDEFLRFSFYRHLLPPYTHQYANGCGRMDIYPLAVMYFLYQSGVLDWPCSDGKYSLKLADINEVNQLFSGIAHDAMVDVEVTLVLARRLIKSRKMWDYLLGYFNKTTNQERFLKLPLAFEDRTDVICRQALLIDGKFGSDLFYQWPVLYLGQHNVYKNQSLCLRVDLENLSATTAENIPENTWVFRKKLGESGLLLPMQGHYSEKLNAQRKELVQHNLQWLQSNGEILEAIGSYHKGYIYPVVENLDIDAALYAGGFLTRQEEQLCERFHRVSLNEKSKIILLFSNENLRMRAIRIMGRYYPDDLPDQYREDFSRYMARVYGVKGEVAPLINYKGGQRFTVQEALNQIKELRENRSLDAQQEKLLDELEQYCVSLGGSGVAEKSEGAVDSLG